MARTTTDAVEAIVEVDPAIEVDPFIEVANSIVTEVCASATNSDGTAFYEDPRLELIERWLSAHFYAIRDQRRAQESVSGITEQVQYKVDLGFNQTIYGQQAMLLDTAGGLGRLQRQTKDGTRLNSVSISWLGTAEA